jgi:hypothetical protein
MIIEFKIQTILQLKHNKGVKLIKRCTIIYVIK